MNNDYSDIIDLKRPLSANHPPMSMHDRAAQFSPFASLTGYDDIIRESGRETEEAFEYSDDAAIEIGQQLALLEEKISDRPTVKITYFVSDPFKDGGQYITKTGRADRIDAMEQILVVSDKTKIRFQDIRSIELI